MCNAWNHPPGCTCGWGGEGHLGVSYGGYSSSGNEYLSSWQSWTGWGLFDRVESFTNPNAICPVCGASVFFYQSPDGGRVFFDELGPPWPKHPCTDSLERVKVINNTNMAPIDKSAWTSMPFRLVVEMRDWLAESSLDNSFKDLLDYCLKLAHDHNLSDPVIPFGQWRYYIKMREGQEKEKFKWNHVGDLSALPKWALAGWNPVIVKTVERIDADFVKIEGVCNEDDVTLYIKFHRNNRSKFSDLSKSNFIAFARQFGERFHVSLLLRGIPPEVLDGLAARFLADARIFPALTLRLISSRRLTS